MYTFDDYDGALVLDGFENGIADSPYAGISNMRNVNITSIPGEASVNFAVSQTSSNIVSSVTVTSVSSNILTFSGGAAGLLKNQAIYFTSVSGLTGVSINTPYWAINLGGAPSLPTSCELSNAYGSTTPISISGTPSGAAFQSYNVGVAPDSSKGAPTFFTQAGQYYYMIDERGQVWSNRIVATRYDINQSIWTFTGNTGSADTQAGNGLVYYIGIGSGAVGYVFKWGANTIDYFNTSTLTWTYGWNPSNGMVGQSSSGLNSSGTHMALWAPDGTVYFCDGTYVGTFFQTLEATAFVPTSTSTYTYAPFQLVPIDTAQCLTFLGSNILIGGAKNIVYSWDRSSPLPSNYILFPENNVVQMVTVNTNTFVFIGNRGRIYITNGTNAQLYKKIPDHISGTVEPYFNWGGACFQKNQLYFSAECTTNAGVVVNEYGGVWAIDLDTEAIRLTNQLSYGTYAGFAPAIIANTNTNPLGEGLFMGWDNGSFGYGIDATTSTPYTGSQATIDFDLIPIGSFNKPRDLTQIEYKLNQPLVNGESVTINTRLLFNTSDYSGANTAAIYSSTLTDSVVGDFSNTGAVNFANAQWLQIQVVLNSTSASPTFTRLKQIRILGLTGPTLAQAQQFSI